MKGEFMSIATSLLKADYVGVKEFRAHLSKILKGHKPCIVTDRGHPTNVLLPYSDMIELADILDELSDPETIETIKQGRKAIESGAQGIPVSKLFKKLGS